MQLHIDTLTTPYLKQSLGYSDYHLVMSRSKYSAFLTHLQFFSTATTPPRLTILSALRAGLQLGLNLPVAVILSISLRLLYAPFPYIWLPINVDQIPHSRHRSQLTCASLPAGKSNYTCSDLLQLLSASENGGGILKRAIDQGHIIGFWTMAANARTHMVSRDDVERFQQGDWQRPVVARRRGRRDDILPLWRGGPIWVSGHSWAVKKLTDVRVYEIKQQ